MTDDIDWLTALPEPARTALVADPGAALPPDPIPRLYRATYGTDDPATGEWALRRRYAEAVRLQRGRLGATQQVDA